MSPNSHEHDWLIYNQFQMNRFLKSQSLTRRILARFFEKYCFTKEEFDTWFWKD